MAAISISENNLFTYCRNNPISNIDSEGELAVALGSMLIGATVGAAINVASTCLTAIAFGQELSGRDIITAAAIGAFNGSFGKATAIMNGVAAIISGVTTGISCRNNGASLGASVLCGFGSAALTFAFSSTVGTWVNGSPLSNSTSAVMSATFGTGATFTSTTMNTLAAGSSRSQPVAVNANVSVQTNTTYNPYSYRTNRLEQRI